MRWLLCVCVVGVIVAVSGGTGAYSGFGRTGNAPPTIPVIERNLANALAKARTTVILRVHLHRNGSPQYVTAVDWVDLGSGDRRMLDYDASGRLKSDTSHIYSGSLPPDPNSACGCDLGPFTNFGTELPVSLLGYQTNDRRRTLHLRFTPSRPVPSTIDFWIDRSTYLPVHEKVVYREPSGNSHPIITVTNDFTWLPRTSANLAQVAGG